MDDKTVSARNISLDLLRIVATAAVVLLHTAKRVWYNVPVSSTDWYISNIYLSAVRWAVPVFVMISGALFLSRDVSIKKLYGTNILRMATAFIFWSFIYALLWHLEGLETKESIKLFIQGNFHLWFLPMIMGLYMALPVLKKITEDEKLTKYFLLLSFIFAFVVPQVISYVTFFSEEWGGVLSNLYGNFHIDIFLGYPFYFILGYMISSGKISVRRFASVLIGICGLLITVLMTIVFTSYKDQAVDIAFDYMSINVMLMAVGMFALFVKKDSASKLSQKGEKAVVAVSKACFGVYLIHEAILIVIKSQLKFDMASTIPALSIPVVMIIAFAVSLGLSLIIGLIPGAKKYIV